ncbi:uncharacterized protein LOC129285278 isoform X2 [Prosopis cineraria]|uniref:uncharacterized protein LOC129285278 isoform X2 n=1 Tax=Prosopis cineraria TaxID=364024 RepID=UPI00240F5859|nr:uncharacterized protein LOC129285278 isoform X2 [Prosopis cineraria]
MTDVLPRLIGIRLANLPPLHTICHELVLQNPNFSLTSANDSSKELYALASSLFRREILLEDDHYFFYEKLVQRWTFEASRNRTKPEQGNSSSNLANREEASQEIVEDDSAIHKQYSSLPNLREIEEEGSQNIIREDSARLEHANASPNLENSEEASKRIAEKDSTAHKQSSNLPNMTKNMNATTNEIVEEQEQLSSSHTAATSSSNLDMEVEAVREGLSSEKNDTNKEKIEASAQESPKLEEAVMSNEVQDSKLKTIPAPFGSPLQVESAQETMEEANVLKGQRSGEAVLADEVMDLNLSNISSPFSSASQIESPQVAKETMEPNVREGSKLDEASKADQIMISDLTNTVPTKSAIPSKNKSPHVNLVHKVPSISAHGKPQIETSTAPLELECSHSDLPDISATTESAQVWVYCISFRM